MNLRLIAENIDLRHKVEALNGYVDTLSAENEALRRLVATEQSTIIDLKKRIKELEEGRGS